VYPQRTGNLDEVLDTDALLAAFDLADVEWSHGVEYHGRIMPEAAPESTGIRSPSTDFTYDVFRNVEDCAGKTPISLQPIDSAPPARPAGKSQTPNPKPQTTDAERARRQ